MFKLFIGGFPLDMVELELVKLISPYGTVNTIKIVRDKKTGKCKGYAFLEMTDLKGVQDAIEALDGTMLDNRLLSLNVVQEKPAAPQRPVIRKTNTTFAKPGYNRPAPPQEAVKNKRPRKQF